MPEIVEHVRIDVASASNVPSETVEAADGLIVFEKDGLLHLRAIPWALARKTRDGPPTRLGLVADLTNPMQS